MVALGQRLERHEHATGVGGAAALPAAARERHHVADRRIGHHHVDELAHLLAHGRERDVLLGLDAPVQPPRVLLREEALGHHDEQVDVEADRAERDEQDHELVPEDPAERPPIEAVDAVEGGLADAIEPAVADLVTGLQELRAHHRRRAQ